MGQMMNGWTNTLQNPWKFFKRKICWIIMKRKKYAEIVIMGELLVEIMRAEEDVQLYETGKYF